MKGYLGKFFLKKKKGSKAIGKGKEKNEREGSALKGSLEKTIGKG